jgi:hypothetical protein
LCLGRSAYGCSNSRGRGNSLGKRGRISSLVASSGVGISLLLTAWPSNTERTKGACGVPIIPHAGCLRNMAWVVSASNSPAHRSRCRAIGSEAVLRRASIPEGVTRLSRRTCEDNGASQGWDRHPGGTLSFSANCSLPNPPATVPGMASLEPLLSLPGATRRTWLRPGTCAGLRSWPSSGEERVGPAGQRNYGPSRGPMRRSRALC